MLVLRAAHGSAPGAVRRRRAAANGYCHARSKKQNEPLAHLSNALLSTLAEHKLFIGKLPTTVTEELLRQIFAPYGNIEKLNILKGIHILLSICEANTLTFLTPSTCTAQARLT